VAAPVRTMVVHCPDWPVVAAGARPDEPAVVVHANRVVAATPAARAEGVAPGLRRREAQGRCPMVAVHEADDSRDARAFEAIAVAVEHFTPRLEVTLPGRVAFSTRGPSRYFGGDQALAEQVVTQVDRALGGFGWAGVARLGVADGPFAAEVAARRAANVLVVPPGEAPVFLAPLGIGTLGRPELVDLFVRLGLRTLGALAALDAGDVLGRFGPDGLLAHRLASGIDERPPAERVPPPDLVVSADLDPPAERVDTAAFVAKALADELHDRLGALGLACTRVLVSAETEYGEISERLWRHEGVLGAGAVADRVRWQLDGWLNGSAAVRPTSGIARLSLVPDEVVPATGRQLGFWGGTVAADDDVVRAVARVQGLLGVEAVTVPEWRGGRGPAEQVARVPAAAVDLTPQRAWRTPGGSAGLGGPGAAAAPWPGAVPSPSPAVVHDPPVPVVVVDADGQPVVVGGRGLLRSTPVRLARRADLDGDGEGVDRVDRTDTFVVPASGVDLVAWAGPWLADERWWDRASHRRRARLQVVTVDGAAHLLAVEQGRWWLEATYD